MWFLWLAGIVLEDAWGRGLYLAVYLVAGGKDGYVGRDGLLPPGEEQRVRAIHDLGS